MDRGSAEQVAAATGQLIDWLRTYIVEWRAHPEHWPALLANGTYAQAVYLRRLCSNQASPQLIIVPPPSSTVRSWWRRRRKGQRLCAKTTVSMGDGTRFVADCDYKTFSRLWQRALLGPWAWRVLIRFHRSFGVRMRPLPRFMDFVKPSGRRICLNPKQICWIERRDEWTS
jgi:hypothetical protein